MSDYRPNPISPLSKKLNIKIAIVQADFNREYSDKLFSSALEGFEAAEISEENIQRIIVPGSLEIPAITKQLQNSGEFSGILALGIVIKGGTNHYEIVTEETSRGLMQCSLQSSIPVINGVLGGNNNPQIEERLSKGFGFAQGLISMIEISEKIQDFNKN